LHWLLFFGVPRMRKIAKNRNAWCHTPVTQRTQFWWSLINGLVTIPMTAAVPLPIAKSPFHNTSEICFLIFWFLKPQGRPNEVVLKWKAVMLRWFSPPRMHPGAKKNQKN
jgi:hypothetical protein